MRTALFAFGGLVKFPDRTEKGASFHPVFFGRTVHVIKDNNHCAADASLSGVIIPGALYG